MENNMIIYNDHDKEAHIMVHDSVNGQRVDRLIAWRELFEIAYHGGTEKILSIKDRKGTLHIYWKAEPTSEERFHCEKCWLQLNEDQVWHFLYDKEI